MTSIRDLANKAKGKTGPDWFKTVGFMLAVAAAGWADLSEIKGLLDDISGQNSKMIEQLAGRMDQVEVDLGVIHSQHVVMMETLAEVSNAIEERVIQEGDKPKYRHRDPLGPSEGPGNRNRDAKSWKVEAQR